MDLHQQRLVLRHALSLLLRTIDTIHPHDGIVRELARAGLGSTLVEAVKLGVKALEVTENIPIR